jgi:hypothetical protein
VGLFILPCSAAPAAATPGRARPGLSFADPLDDVDLLKAGDDALSY